MTHLRVLGIMNGTSLDGVDFVVCDVQYNPLSIQFVEGRSAHFPPQLKNKLYQAATNQMSGHEVAELHHELGRFYASTVKKWTKTKAFKDLNLVGLHGQTIYHHAPTATLQVGEPSYLAEALRRPIASDFRPADLAFGGQGAPLATFFHYVALRDFFKGTSFAVHNLGGISNLSFFPKNHQWDASDFATAKFAKKILAFDTGPANMLVDLRINELTKGKKKFDQNGQWASQGVPAMKLVNKWSKHPYFQKRPPKSCGREEFGKTFLDSIRNELRKLSPEDQISSLTELTAVTVASAYRKFLPHLPKVVVFCGGGSFNPHMMFRIRYHLPEITVLTSSTMGWPEQAVEGAAFALLAACRAWGIKAHFSSTTGAREPTVLGKLTLGQ